MAPPNRAALHGSPPRAPVASALPRLSATMPHYPEVDRFDPVAVELAVLAKWEAEGTFRQSAEDAALERGVPLRQGVYVAVVGPNLETRAEYRFLRQIGADVVGMSTVPEVIVARHQGMRCLAISVVTDECFPDALEAVRIEDILAAAAQAEPSLTALMGDVVASLA